MHKPRICTVVTGGNADLIRRAEPISDLFELRMDLVGEGWQDMVPHLHKPWIATMRDTLHAGKFTGSEKQRTSQLMRAVELGAGMVDIELDCPSLEVTIKSIKSGARCLVSYHNWDGTPPPEDLSIIVRRQQAAGADICKVVTMAANINDNLTLIDLPSRFPGADIISFCMGPAGMLSRVLSPLAGGYLTYASLDDDMGSAPGQLSVSVLRGIYRKLLQ